MGSVIYLLSQLLAVGRMIEGGEKSECHTGGSRGVRMARSCEIVVRLIILGSKTIGGRVRDFFFHKKIRPFFGFPRKFFSLILTSIKQN